MSRLVVVSNRVAVDAAQAAPGGLAVALRSLLQERGGLWFGWSGRVAARRHAALRVQLAGARQVATLDLSRAEYDGFYRGYCNAVLWPLCHGLGGTTRQAGAVAYPSYLGRQSPLRGGAGAAAARRRSRLGVDFHLIPLGDFCAAPARRRHSASSCTCLSREIAHSRRCRRPPA